MIWAEYLTGVENTIEDQESMHHQDNSNWQLRPSIFNALDSLMGPFSIDLFASRTNHQLPTYYNWKPNLGALTVDAFSIYWAKMTPYMFV